MVTIVFLEGRREFYNFDTGFSLILVQLESPFLKDTTFPENKEEPALPLRRRRVPLLHSSPLLSYPIIS